MIERDRFLFYHLLIKPNQANVIIERKFTEYYYPTERFTVLVTSNSVDCNLRGTYNLKLRKCSVVVKVVSINHLLALA